MSELKYYYYYYYYYYYGRLYCKNIVLNTGLGIDTIYKI